MENNQYLNPFDNEEINFFVLINPNKQYSLWPEFAAIPDGWKKVLGPASRSESSQYVEKNWKSISPFQNITVKE